MILNAVKLTIKVDHHTKKENLKYFHHLCEVLDLLITLKVVVIPKYVHMSEHHIVYLMYIDSLLTEHTLLKLREEILKIKTRASIELKKRKEEASRV